MELIDRNKLIYDSGTDYRLFYVSVNAAGRPRMATAGNNLLGLIWLRGFRRALLRTGSSLLTYDNFVRHPYSEAEPVAQDEEPELDGPIPCSREVLDIMGPISGGKSTLTRDLLVANVDVNELARLRTEARILIRDHGHKFVGTIKQQPVDDIYDVQTLQYLVSDLRRAAGLDRETG